MPVQLTLVPAIVIVLIALLLGFWLFAPTGMVVKMLNAVGGVLQAIWAKVKGLFAKKAAASPAPVAPEPATILPANPSETKTEVK